MAAPIRALLVEDDDRLARFTKEYLEQRGVLVTHVRDGERGRRGDQTGKGIPAAEVIAEVRRG
jgi:DNA-binding response OmpR family regulator